MLALARMMAEDGQSAKAFDLCQTALRLAPGDGKLAARIRSFVNASVPAWHFGIVFDEARNAAYEAALRRAVTSDSRVLEIGCGTGLFAMMAARAGAGSVVACERTPAVANKAAEIVARNGYADRIRVIAKHSSELDAEADLGGRADVLVSELIGNRLVFETVLSAHEHAVRDLLKPEARIIPARGVVRVALGHDKRKFPNLTNIAGFDLSPFESLAPTAADYSVGDELLTLRSDAADLFSFDFASTKHFPAAETSLDCVSTGGEINGVAQWIALTLDETAHYENRPTPGKKYSAWAVQFYRFARPIQTISGQTIRIHGAHNRESLRIWADTGM